jgi:hypothetical protein
LKGTKLANTARGEAYHNLDGNLVCNITENITKMTAELAELKTTTSSDEIECEVMSTPTPKNCFVAIST